MTANIKPVLPEIAISAFNAFMAGYVSNEPFTPRPFVIEDENGEDQEFQLADKPLNRGLVAMMRGLPDDCDPDAAMATGMRMMALLEFMNKHGDRLPAKFIIQADDNHGYLHAAVIEAAALAPLNDNGFRFKALLAEARKRYDQHAEEMQS